MDCISCFSSISCCIFGNLVFLTFLPPLGLSSSQVEVEMLHSAVVKGAALPVCKTSSRAVLPCLGGPITSIFSSLKCSAFRSCARRRAKTEMEPYKRKQKTDVSNCHFYCVQISNWTQGVNNYCRKWCHIVFILLQLFHCHNDKWEWSVLPLANVRDFECLEWSGLASRAPLPPTLA